MKCVKCKSPVNKQHIYRIMEGTKKKIVGINYYCTNMQCNWEVDGRIKQGKGDVDEEESNKEKEKSKYDQYLEEINSKGL